MKSKILFLILLHWCGFVALCEETGTEAPERTSAEIREILERGKQAYRDSLYAEARDLFLSIQEDGEAQYWLGDLYGLGLLGGDYKYFEKEGFRWYKRSAENGYIPGKSSLGYAYYDGVGVNQDLREAEKWLRMAAEGGDNDACRYMALMYSNGDGVRKDYVEAVNWYRKAADNGDLRATGILGYMYENGFGVPKDTQEALRLYLKSAEGGDPESQALLGDMYENGRIVSKDMNEAIKWYKLSAAQECPMALFALDRLLSGEGEEDGDE